MRTPKTCELPSGPNVSGCSPLRPDIEDVVEYGGGNRATESVSLVESPRVCEVRTKSVSRKREHQGRQTLQERPNIVPVEDNR